jgi:hypothetical protein
MKLSLSLGLIVTAASALAACSSDEGAERTPNTTVNPVGAGGAPVGAAGAGTGGTGAGIAGATAGGAGGAGGAAATNFTPGAAFTITADGNVVDGAGTTGINGGTFLSQSLNMTVDAATAHRAGGLCFSGTTAVVPSSADYGTYWGAELGLNLKLVPDPDAPPPAAVADAGADAGPVVALEPASWPYGNVIGFSYKVVGNSPAAADKGVPAARVRFKALPTGSVGANDSYCSSRDGLIDGAVDNVLFDDITFECWNVGNPSIGPGEATINRVNPGPPIVVETPANPKALVNISWQIASDVLATTPAPIAFDFCITELKPLLAAP